MSGINPLSIINLNLGKFQSQFGKIVMTSTLPALNGLDSKQIQRQDLEDIRTKSLLAGDGDLLQFSTLLFNDLKMGKGSRRYDVNNNGQFSVSEAANAFAAIESHQMTGMGQKLSATDALFTAAANGDVAGIKDALFAGAEIDAQDDRRHRFNKGCCGRKA